MNASSVNWRNKIHDKMKQGTIEHVITVKSSNHAERIAVVFIRIFRISACFFFFFFPASDQSTFSITQVVRKKIIICFLTKQLALY